MEPSVPKNDFLLNKSKCHGTIGTKNLFNYSHNKDFLFNLSISHGTIGTKNIFN